MELEDFELVEAQVQDIRFGIINIYQSRTEPDILIMEKSRRSQSNEDHGLSCMQAEERMKIKHPNILKMLWVDKDDMKWVTNAYFQYPNEDLYDRQEQLQNPREVIHFLNDMLEAMCYLQRNKMVHGDFRPEYIYFNELEEKYVLLDRLIDASPAHKAQLNNIFYQDRPLYMSPKLFDSLSKDMLKVKHNPFKSEVFSLGMVVAMMTVSAQHEDLINNCYNRGMKCFDLKAFGRLVEHLQTDIFLGPVGRLIGQYLLAVVLNIDEKRRQRPRKALKILRKGVCAMIGNSPVGEIQDDGGETQPNEGDQEGQNKEKNFGKKMPPKNMQMIDGIKNMVVSPFVSSESSRINSKSTNPQYDLSLQSNQFEMPQVGGGDDQSLPSLSQNGGESGSNHRTHLETVHETNTPTQGVTTEQNSSLIPNSQATKTKPEETTQHKPSDKNPMMMEFHIDQSASQTNGDTFNGSGSNMTDKVDVLNDIYRTGVNNLQRFLNNKQSQGSPPRIFGSSDYQDFEFGSGFENRGQMIGVDLHKKGQTGEVNFQSCSPSMNKVTFESVPSQVERDPETKDQTNHGGVKTAERNPFGDKTPPSRVGKKRSQSEGKITFMSQERSLSGEKLTDFQGQQNSEIKEEDEETDSVFRNVGSKAEIGKNEELLTGEARVRDEYHIEDSQLGLAQMGNMMMGSGFTLGKVQSTFGSKQFGSSGFEGNFGSSNITENARSRTASGQKIITNDPYYSYGMKNDQNMIFQSRTLESLRKESQVLDINKNDAENVLKNLTGINGEQDIERILESPSIEDKTFSELDKNEKQENELNPFSDSETRFKPSNQPDFIESWRNINIQKKQSTRNVEILSEPFGSNTSQSKDLREGVSADQVTETYQGSGKSLTDTFDKNMRKDPFESNSELCPQGSMARGGQGTNPLQPESNQRQPRFESEKAIEIDPFGKNREQGRAQDTNQKYRSLNEQARLNPFESDNRELTEHNESQKIEETSLTQTQEEIENENIFGYQTAGTPETPENQEQPIKNPQISRMEAKEENIFLYNRVDHMTTSPSQTDNPSESMNEYPSSERHTETPSEISTHGRENTPKRDSGTGTPDSQHKSPSLDRRVSSEFLNIPSSPTDQQSLMNPTFQRQNDKFNFFSPDIGESARRRAKDLISNTNSRKSSNVEKTSISRQIQELPDSNDRLMNFGDFKKKLLNSESRQESAILSEKISESLTNNDLHRELEQYGTNELKGSISVESGFTSRQSSAIRGLKGDIKAIKRNILTSQKVRSESYDYGLRMKTNKNYERVSEENPMTSIGKNRTRNEENNDHENKKADELEQSKFSDEEAELKEQNFQVRPESHKLTDSTLKQLDVLNSLGRREVPAANGPNQETIIQIEYLKSLKRVSLNTMSESLEHQNGGRETAQDSGRDTQNTDQIFKCFPSPHNPNANTVNTINTEEMMNLPFKTSNFESNEHSTQTDKNVQSTGQTYHLSKWNVENEEFCSETPQERPQSSEDLDLIKIEDQHTGSSRLQSSQGHHVNPESQLEDSLTTLSPQHSLKHKQDSHLRLRKLVLEKFKDLGEEQIRQMIDVMVELDPSEFTSEKLKQVRGQLEGQHMMGNQSEGQLITQQEVAQTGTKFSNYSLENNQIMSNLEDTTLHGPKTDNLTFQRKNRDDLMSKVKESVERTQEEVDTHRTMSRGFQGTFGNQKDRETGFFKSAIESKSKESSPGISRNPENIFKEDSQPGTPTEDFIKKKSAHFVETEEASHEDRGYNSFATGNTFSSQVKTSRTQNESRPDSSPQSLGRTNRESENENYSGSSKRHDTLGSGNRPTSHDRESPKKPFRQFVSLRGEKSTCRSSANSMEFKSERDRRKGIHSSSSQTTVNKEMRSEDNISEDIYLSDNVVDKNQFQNSRVEDLMLNEAPSQQEIEESFQKNLEYRGLENEDFAQHRKSGTLQEGMREGSHESSEEETGDLDMRQMGGRGVFATISERTEECGLSDIGNNDSAMGLFIGKRNDKTDSEFEDISVTKRQESQDKGSRFKYVPGKRSYKTQEENQGMEIGPLGRVQLVHIMKENIKNVEIIQATSFQDSSGQLTVGQNSKIKEEGRDLGKENASGEIHWSEDEEELAQTQDNLEEQSELFEQENTPRIQENSNTRPESDESDPGVADASDHAISQEKQNNESGSLSQSKKLQQSGKEQKHIGTKKTLILGLKQKIRTEEIYRQTKSENQIQNPFEVAENRDLKNMYSKNIDYPRFLSNREKGNLDFHISLGKMLKEKESQSESQEQDDESKNKELPILEVKSLRSERSGGKITIVEPVRANELTGVSRELSASKSADNIFSKEYAELSRKAADLEQPKVEKCGVKVQTCDKPKSETEDNAIISDKVPASSPPRVELQDLRKKHQIIRNISQQIVDPKSEGSQRLYQTCPKLTLFQDEEPVHEKMETYYRTETEKDHAMRVGFEMGASDTEKLTHPFTDLTSQLDTIMSKMNSDLNEFSKIGESPMGGGSMGGSMGVRGEILLSKVSEGGMIGSLRRERGGKFEITEELNLEVLKEDDEKDTRSIVDLENEGEQNEDDMISISEKVRKMSFEIDHVESSVVRNQSLEISESHLMRNKFNTEPGKRIGQEGSSTHSNLLINAFNSSNAISNAEFENEQTRLRNESEESLNRGNRGELNLMLDEIESSQGDTATKDQHTQVSRVFGSSERLLLFQKLMSPKNDQQSHHNVTVETDSHFANVSISRQEDSDISPQKNSYQRKKRKQIESHDFKIEFCDINPNLQRFFTDQPKPVSPPNTNSVTELFGTFPQSRASHHLSSPLQNTSAELSADTLQVKDREIGGGHETVVGQAEILGEYMGFGNSDRITESLLKAKSFQEHTDFSNSGNIQLKNKFGDGLGIGDLIHKVMEKSQENNDEQYYQEEYHTDHQQ